MVSHKEMFDSLVKLCEESDVFFYHDYVFGSERFRFFNYRSASYSDWLKPYALECRGRTFKIDNEGNYHSLVCRPFAKFFNIYENPFTMNLDFSETVGIYKKIDGLLVSSLTINDSIWLQSKESLDSDVAFAATKLLHTDEYSDLLNFVKEQERNGITVCLEYTDPHPDFRVVIGYDKPALTALGLISVNTGNELDLESFNDHPAARFFVKNMIEEVGDPIEFINKVPKMKKIEGYVLVLSSGQRIKLKTEWYKKLHARRRRARKRAGLRQSQRLWLRFCDFGRGLKRFFPAGCRKHNN